jgi:hypothetical protein
LVEKVRLRAGDILSKQDSTTVLAAKERIEHKEFETTRYTNHTK